MPTDAQKLKATGHLRDVDVNDVPNLAADPQATAVFADGYCGFPDAPDPQLAKANPKDLVDPLGMPLERCEELVEAHAGYLEHVEAKKFGFATGSGSVSVGCHDKYPEHHAFHLFIDRDTYPSHLKRFPTTNELDGIVRARTWEIHDDRLYRVNGNAKSRLPTSSNACHWWTSNETFSLPRLTSSG